MGREREEKKKPEIFESKSGAFHQRFHHQVGKVVKKISYLVSAHFQVLLRLLLLIHFRLVRILSLKKQRFKTNMFQRID